MKCNAPGCDQDSRASGLCHAHYFRLRRHGSFDKPKTRRERLLEGGKSYCPKCKEEKLVSEFNVDTHTAWGTSIYCKVCSSEKGKTRYRENRKKYHDYKMAKDFGLGLGVYEQMLDSQGGSCAICRGHNQSNRALAVDHDHGTGAVRGILCDRCNFLLSNAQDSVEILEAAIRYLTNPGLVHGAAE
jgi:transcription elongation factor Elf1